MKYRKMIAGVAAAVMALSLLSCTGASQKADEPDKPMTLKEEVMEEMRNEGTWEERMLLHENIQMRNTR